MIAITGATGTTVSELVAELLRRAEIRALTRDPQQATSMLGSEVQIVAADFERRDTFDVALRGIEAVYLLAPDSPQMVQQECNVIEAAAAAGVRRIVQQSAFGADPASPINFLRWHAESEHRLLVRDNAATFRAHGGEDEVIRTRS